MPRRYVASATAQFHPDSHTGARDFVLIYGDELETMAIKTVFGDHARTVPISSTKSMTGHLLGAAGGVEAVISILALERGILPPTINLENADPECDLDYVPNQARPMKIDVAMSNSFGFGGHNASIVLGRFKG